MMAQITKMMGAMVVKSDLEQLPTKSDVKLLVAEAVDPLKNEIVDLKQNMQIDIDRIDTNIDNMASRIDVLENRPADMQMGDESSQNAKDIKELKERLRKMDTLETMMKNMQRGMDQENSEKKILILRGFNCDEDIVIAWA